MVSLILFGSFFLLLFLSVPIAYALGLASLFTIFITHTIDISFLTNSIITSLDSFPLMAVPFFILAGDIMGKGGISKRLFEFANSLVGGVTGGLAMAAVVTCMFFAAISGSGPATVAAVGGIMLPIMLSQGYERDFSTAVVTAAGAIGVIIPPSIPMVMYGVSSGASVSSLFVAGVIPGILMGIVMMIWCYVYCKKAGYKKTGDRFSWKNVLRAFWDAKWSVLVPVIVLGGIYGGYFTPTEASVVSVVYSLVISVFVYREIKLKDLPSIMAGSALTTAIALIICGTVATFGKLMTIERIPEMVASAIASFSTSKIITLLLLNLVLLLAGCFLDTVSAILILTPILWPVANAIGVDIIHFGIIMVVNLSIGFITPPVGVNLYVGTSMSGLPLEALVKKILPFFAVMIIALILITYVPGLSLLLLK